LSHTVSQYKLHQSLQATVKITEITRHKQALDDEAVTLNLCQWQATFTVHRNNDYGGTYLSCSEQL